MIEKQFLSSDELEEYRKLIQIAIISTYYNRSYNFHNLPERIDRSRCLHCGQSFLFVKDKRKYRYCTSKCKDGFNWTYGMFGRSDRLWDKQKGLCNHCKNPLGDYDIDHIQEIARFQDNKFLQAKMYLDPNNLQLLCKPCHRSKTKAFLREWLGKPKPEVIEIPKRKTKSLMEYL